MSLVVIYGMPLIALICVLLFVAGAYWPIQRIYMAVCSLPLFALLLAIYFRDWLSRQLSYGVYVLLSQIVLASLALSLLGVGLICKSSNPKERCLMSGATLIALAPTIIAAIAMWFS
jgi:hypothetical protein